MDGKVERRRRWGKGKLDQNIFCELPTKNENNSRAKLFPLFFEILI